MMGKKVSKWFVLGFGGVPIGFALGLMTDSPPPKISDLQGFPMSTVDHPEGFNDFAAGWITGTGNVYHGSSSGCYRPVESPR